MKSLLFDLFACQSGRGIMNHGGKEYGEAIFAEIMRRGFPISGIYNPEEEVKSEFVEYCREKGDLIDMRQTSLQDAINTGKYDVFYSALPYSWYNVDWGNTTFIGSLHGLRAIEAFTDKYEYKYANDVKSLIKALVKSIPFVQSYKNRETLNQIGRILNNPSFVCITGSEHSKYSLLNYFPTESADKIHVFYDPLTLEDANAVANTIGEKYYLLVSGNRWLKNTYRGIKALDELICAGQVRSKVVVTGTVPGMKYLKEIKNKDSFIFKGYVSSGELASLYKNAYCLVFLSLSEGFGYPPLEAISRGTPVVCSPLTALYEVYQNSVLYCNPLSIEDIKVKILEMENKEIYNRYKARGQEYSYEMIKLQERELPKLVDFILSYC